jgi:type I restriction enzyme M protein
VLFLGGEEREARKYFITKGYLEAVIGLPGNLFYGTGIPACILVMNKAGAAERKQVLFINADREYREGKAQNFLRPEDSDKIVQAYREGENVPAYARLVPIDEIAAEDYNCNIRRYVDNAPPPEPQDVYAHLHGGVPGAEIDALAHFWDNYQGLRESCFVSRSASDFKQDNDQGLTVRPEPFDEAQESPVEGCTVKALMVRQAHHERLNLKLSRQEESPRASDAKYHDFSDAIADKRAIAALVSAFSGVIERQQTFMRQVEAWWLETVPFIAALAPDPENQSELMGNVYALRRALLKSIGVALGGQNLLTDYQVRGAFANYINLLKADLKSIAASGWGPELIPDHDILISQFPEVLEKMQQNSARLAELQALFATADEEDFDDSEETGVLPGNEVKSLKEELKNLNADWKAQLKTLRGRPPIFVPKSKWRVRCPRVPVKVITAPKVLGNRMLYLPMASAFWIWRNKWVCNRNGRPSLNRRWKPGNWQKRWR